MEVAEAQRALLDWYGVHARVLPWRRTQDPYAILVSEVMLQQTRVDVAAPYFERWLARWPTADALAAADEEDVVAAWSGLGYYRRARNLHAAARRIAADGWPEDLQELPGVGPYIAGAVGSIAFGRPMAAVDGNVERVLSRWFRITDDVRKAAGRRAIQAAAERVVASARPGEWTQAVMELGATVCTPRNPQCTACPTASHCASRDDAEGLPVKATAARPVDEEVHFAVIEQGGRLLLTKRPNGLLAGTWGFPGGARTEPLEDLVRTQVGANVRLHETAGTARHTFSHRRWHMQVRRADVLDLDHRQPAQAVQWIEPKALETVGLSKAMRRAFEAVPGPQPH